MDYENMTHSEIEAAAEQWMHFNNDNCGRAKNPLDARTPVEQTERPRLCHCGQPLSIGDGGECAACTGEWQDWLNECSERREAFGLF